MFAGRHVSCAEGNPCQPPLAPKQQDPELTGHACLQEKRAREEMLQKQSIREQIWKKESPSKVPVYASGLSAGLVGCMYNNSLFCMNDGSWLQAELSMAQHVTAWPNMAQRGTALHSMMQ